MRKPKHLEKLLIILLVLGVSPASSLETQAQTISNYGRIIEPSNPLIESYHIRRQTYYDWITPVSTYATTTDILICKYGSVGKAKEIKSLNPDVLTLLYFNSRHIFTASSSEYIPERLQLFKDNNWILKDEEGSYVSAYNGAAYVIDFGHPDFQTWLATWFKDYIYNYGLDGASIDNWHVSTIAFYGLEQTPINPRTGSAWTNEQVCEAYKMLTTKIRNTIGNDKIIHVNGIFSPDRLYWSGYEEMYEDALINGGVNALTCEAWVSTLSSAEWHSESEWLKGIDFAVWMNKNFLALGNRFFITISDNAGLNHPIGQVILPPGVTKEQYTTYCYASRLLTVENDGNFMCFGSYTIEPYPQSLFEIDLGIPLGAYYRIEGTHIYARDFSSGKILVNPTNSYYSMNIDRYITIEGEEVTSPMKIAPHTGVILRSYNS